MYWTNKIKVQSLIKIENKKSYKAPNKIEKKKKQNTKESETFDWAIKVK